MFKMIKRHGPALLTAVTLALGGALGAALWPGNAAAEDIYVEVDHAKLLKLDADADLIYVANPSIADVTVESPRMLFVVGLQAGQTGLYILDRQGNEMIVGDILVTPNEGHEITLNRNSQEITFSCSPRCSEVAVTGQANAGTFDTSGGGTGGAGDPDLSGLGLIQE